MKRPYHSLLLILLSCYLIPLAVTAATTVPAKPDLAKQYITEILKQPEFQTTREESHWRYLGGDTADPSSLNAISLWARLLTTLAQLLELLLWISLAIGILLLILWAPRWIEKFHSQTTLEPTHTVEPRLLSKTVKSDPLSPNLSQQAWVLWQSGQLQAALSLLYRGALTVLRSREGLTIPDSATERECLRLVQRHQPTELANYFAELIRTWQTLAYAQRPPTDLEVQRLCQEWPQYFHPVS